MADTILGGDLTINYFDDNRRKSIDWTGGNLKTDVQKQKDVYVETENLLTVPTQQNKGLVYSAETPAEYSIGKIDPGDNEPWFISLRTMEHIVGDFQAFTGCALKTIGWTRVVTSNTGIVVVAVANAGNDIVLGDVGLDITHADGDAGTLLDVVVPGGATDYLFIRPDSSAAANNFDSSSLDLTCNGNTATQNAAAVTGEMVWGNFYTKGALTSDTHVYVFQSGTKVSKHDALDQDWWADGQVDRAIPITDFTSATFPIIDEGFITVKANKYGSGHTYDVIAMNTTTGGQIAAALSSGNDGNNNTGYASITHAGAAGNWSVGDEMTGNVTGARSIITQIDNPGATQTTHYYLVGDPLLDFDGSEALTNADDTGTATSSGAVTAQGPALPAWFDGGAFPTVVFGNVEQDISGDSVTEPYSHNWTINQAALSQFYEYSKYVAARGSTFDLNNLDGEEYIGVDYTVHYTGSVTGTVGEGTVVTQVASSSVSTVISHDTTKKVLALRNTRGTHQDGVQLEIDGSNFIAASGLTVTNITPVAENPFGTFAGGNFFGSDGTLINDYKNIEENNFTLKDLDAIERSRPVSVTITITNLLQFDWASTWRLLVAGGEINLTEYSAAGGEAKGDPTLTVDGAIAVDVPNKNDGGRVFIQDVSNTNKEYVMRFATMDLAGGIVTLANSSGAAEGGTNTTNVTDTGAFTAANAKVGDLFWNSTIDAISYVYARVDDDNIEVRPAIAGQSSGDNWELNPVPIAMDAADNVYFPLIHEFVENDGSVSASFEFISNVEARIVVRNTAEAAVKIKGFAVDVVIGVDGGAAITSRITNTVY